MSFKDQHLTDVSFLDISLERYWTSFCRSSPDWITVQVSRGERDIFAVFRGNTSQYQIPGNLTSRSPPGPLRWWNHQDRARWDKRAHCTPSLVDVFRNELVIFYCAVLALTLVAVNFTSSWPIRGMRRTESRIYDPFRRSFAHEDYITYILEWSCRSCTVNIFILCNQVAIHYCNHTYEVIL